MSYLLLPGRHLVNTRFQEEYLFRHVRPPVTHLVFAITSCNQAGSRYNPIPFHVRAIGVDRFARGIAGVLGVRYSILGIPHHGRNPRFAELLLKEVAEQAAGELEIGPENTKVLSSTPEVIAQYEGLGYQMLTVEGSVGDAGAYRITEATPIDIVRRIGEVGEGWLDDDWMRAQIHPASLSVLRDFPEVVRTIHSLYSDPLLGEEGSLTETRDYDTYVRAMGSAVELKYADVAPFLLSGRIIDEGCADGALLARIARDHPDSDLIGIDLCAEMLARAAERVRAGEFSGTFAYFRQGNLMNPVPLRTPVDTVLCNSTLHEIWSYGDGEPSVRHYLQMKRDQLRTGGRLVIRDVVGPAEREKDVLLWCNPDDGAADQPPHGLPPKELEAALNRLSTAAVFRRFAEDFLPETHGAAFPSREASTPRGPGIRLRLQHAMEFITKMGYTDNWESEMEEQFCFWSFDEWQQALRDAGLRIVRGSHPYVNEWRVKNRFEGRVALFDLEGAPLPWPVTTMVLAGERV